MSVEEVAADAFDALAPSVPAETAAQLEKSGHRFFLVRDALVVAVHAEGIRVLDERFPCCGPGSRRVLAQVDRTRTGRIRL